LDGEVKTFSDYLAVVLRRKSLIVLVFVIGALAGVYVTFSITPTYVSSASFRVQQQNVSKDIVQTTVSGYVDEQIQQVRQRVTSVSSLSKVIDDYGLYPERTKGGPASQDVVEKLRNDIILEPEYTEVFNPRSGRTALVTIAFDVIFEYEDPEITQNVMTEIARLILFENQQNRTAQVEETIAFLERDLESSQKNVDQATAVMADFRERHAGNLPDMTDFNLQAVQRTERQIEALDEDIRAARDRKQILEGEMADPNLLATVYDENGEPIVGTAQRLADLQRERLRLLSIYSPEHPDLVSVEKEIKILASEVSSGDTQASDIQNQLDIARTDLAVAKQKYAENHPDVRQLTRAVERLQIQLADALRNPAPTVVAAAQDPVVRQLQLRIQAQEADIRSFQIRRTELVAKVDDYERKLLRMPQIERDYERLVRDSEAAITRHTDIRENLTEARTAGKLEAEGGGARFILTDAPQLPSKPFKPNRLSLLILSVMLALIIGITVAITVDSMDQTVQDSRELIRICDAPPIAIIPYLETRRERLQRIGMNVATSGLVLSGFALAVFIAKNSA
jgi:succinoglycan biosynthesis transport protein ExoP